ncbi:hypothetical protein SNARM312S_04797 [Streptomyces narbonensis]
MYASSAAVPLSDQPGSLFRPKWYFVPSLVVTTQYSPSASFMSERGSLDVSLNRSIFEPSPLALNHLSLDSSHTSSVVMPPRERVAFSEPQHRSAVLWVELFDPAFLESWRQLTYVRLMEPGL